MTTFPLLQSQFGIFMEWMKEPNSTQYNLPFEIKFGKEIDTDQLEKAIQCIISIRPEMRTIFTLIEGKPSQYWNKQMQISVKRCTMTEEEYQDYVEHFVKPFDLLSKEPLWRFSIVETSDATYLLWDVSHIIFDGYTLSLFCNNLSLAYGDEPLTAGSGSLYESAKEEQASFKTDDYKRAAAYYKETFCDAEFVTLSHKSSLDSTLGKLIRKSTFLPISEVDD